MGTETAAASRFENSAETLSVWVANVRTLALAIVAVAGASFARAGAAAEPADPETGPGVEVRFGFEP